MLKSVGVLLLSILLMSGCGGNSTNENSKIEDTGILIDNVVSGAKYVNNGKTGFTDLNGNFPYTGGVAEFFIGNIKIGEISSLPEDKKVFIQDIVGIDRTDTSNEKLLKIATLLQSLDSDSSTDEIEILENDFNKFNDINEDILNVDLNILLPSLSFSVKPQNEVKKHITRVLVYHTIIEDTQAPILSSTNKSFTTTQGTALTLEIVTATDNIDNLANVQQNGTVDFSKVGTYTITYSTTDNAGNNSTITHTYVVNEIPDTQAPVLSSTNKSFTTAQGTALTLEIVTATDNKDSSVSVQQSGTVDFNNIGTYTITYTTTDTAGNSSTITHTYVVEEPITYSWDISDWSSCSGSCGVDNGTQTRSVICQSSKGNSVNDSYCTGTKPDTSRSCTASLCNQAPSITSNNTTNTAENQTTVLTVTATDPENDTITFSLTGGADQALFSIDANSGALTFQNAPDFETPLDANTDNEYIVEVTATDDGTGNLTDTQTITVTVTDVNDNQAPSITSNNTTNTAENQTTVLTVTATDPENDTVTFSLTGGADQALFSIDANSGALTFQNAPDFETPLDANTDNEYIVEVTATDDGTGNLTDTQTITVTITNIGEHYILNAIYDDKRTSAVTDDILYLYMNEEIAPATFNADSSLNYDITGTGVIGSSSTNTYTDTLFHRHKIELNNDGTPSTAFVEDTDTINIKANQIEDANGSTTTVNTTATVKKFNPLARLKTGQTTSYPNGNNTDRDDGYYQATVGIARSYTDNGNSTVTDNATGLIWQQEDDNTTRNWADAGTYCDTLNLGGSTQWRLPTVEELMSITDKSTFNPAINTVFTNTDSSFYWSSTTDASNTSNAWYVYFFFGYGDWSGKTATCYVRCVRSLDN